MPIKGTTLDDAIRDEERLKGLRIKLQREIADQIQEQQRVYDEIMKPNAADAKLLSAQVRGRVGEKPLSPASAKLLEGADTSTARFEVARAEIDRISKLVRSRRTQLEKLERELESVRASLRRARTPAAATPIEGWISAFRSRVGVTAG